MLSAVPQRRWRKHLEKHLMLALSLGLLAKRRPRGKTRAGHSAYPIAQPLFAKYVYEPFKAKCGCDIKVETGNNAAASPSWWCMPRIR